MLTNGGASERLPPLHYIPAPLALAMIPIILLLLKNTLELFSFVFGADVSTGLLMILGACTHVHTCVLRQTRKYTRTHVCTEADTEGKG